MFKYFLITTYLFMSNASSYDILYQQQKEIQCTRLEKEGLDKKEVIKKIESTNKKIKSLILNSKPSRLFNRKQYFRLYKKLEKKLKRYKIKSKNYAIELIKKGCPLI